MMPWTVTVEGVGTCTGKDGEDVLSALERQGHRFVDVGCRRGGCGVCRVRVTDGDYRTLKMSRARVSAEDEACGMALACRLIPEGDCTVVPEPLSNRFPATTTNARRSS